MKRSAQLFVLLFISIPVFISCNFSNQKTIYGNHQLINQQIDIENYDKVVLKIPAEVFYQQFSDSAPYLQIHTDENIFKSLNFRIENNQLILEATKDSIIKPSKLTIYTCSHNLNQVTVTGSGNIRLKGEVNAIDFKVDIIGSGNFLSDSLLCNNITARITGSGKIQLTGASNQSLYTITGSGNIYAFNYLIQNLKCNIVGSGDIEASVSNQLEASITGSGNLSYKGDPQSINKKIVGSGKVQPER